jgi:uncharacterized protein YbjQ (UPF0145 family)
VTLRQARDVALRGLRKVAMAVGASSVVISIACYLATEWIAENLKPVEPEDSDHGR